MMNTGESSVAHGPEHGLERLIFFSDAVFAIAITLLVIDLHVPHLRFGSPDTAYWSALVELAPEFAGFFISFYVIGFFWAGHHRTMAVASHYSPSLILPNMLLLSTVAALPFFTGFVSANPMMRVPAFCYCAWLVVTAIANRYLQAKVTRAPIVDPVASAVTVATIRQRGTAVILGTVTAMLVSLAFPPLGQVALTSIPLWRLVLRRRSHSQRLVSGRLVQREQHDVG